MIIDHQQYVYGLENYPKKKKKHNHKNVPDDDDDDEPNSIEQNDANLQLYEIVTQFSYMVHILDSIVPFFLT